MTEQAPTIAYIGLGSNEGDRSTTIIRALSLLDSYQGVTMGVVSQLIETNAVGGPDNQAMFLNGAAELHCQLSAEELLKAMQDIEKQLGRIRKEKWGPRTIDLDLLLFGSEIINKEHLKVPHPLMHERIFVMRPLAQIKPDILHPVLKKTARNILKELEM